MKRHLATTPQWKLATTALAAGLCVLAGCSDSPTGPELRDLNRAENLWKAVTNPSSPYTMDQLHSCECGYAGRTFHVTVYKGVVTSAVDALTGVAVPEDQLSAFRSVEQLFARIRALLDTKGARVSATYDNGAGYPTSAYFDPNPVMVDDEILIHTSNVATPLD